MRLADLIKGRREKLGWSQRKLASKAGVDPSAISRIERGLQIGHAETLARIAAALGLSPGEVDAALREQEAEAGEIQMIDLRNVPPEERAALRRAIDALVREWQRGGEDGA